LVFCWITVAEILFLTANHHDGSNSRGASRPTPRTAKDTRNPCYFFYFPFLCFYTLILYWIRNTQLS